MRWKQGIALTVITLMITSTALAAPAPPQQGGGMKAAPAPQQLQPLPVQPAPAKPLGGHRTPAKHRHDSDSSFFVGMLGAIIGAVIGSAATSGN